MESEQENPIRLFLSSPRVPRRRHVAGKFTTTPTPPACRRMHASPGTKPHAATRFIRIYGFFMSETSIGSRGVHKANRNSPGPESIFRWKISVTLVPLPAGEEMELCVRNRGRTDRQRGRIIREYVPGEWFESLHECSRGVNQDWEMGFPYVFNIPLLMRGDSAEFMIRA